MEKTLSDEIAMTMPLEVITSFENKEAIIEFATAHDISLDFDDIISMIDFGMAYQGIIRYKYADQMIKHSLVTKD